MYKLDLEKAKEPEIKLAISADHRKSNRVPEKHLLLLYWLCQSFWLRGSQQTVENYSRDGNTRPPYVPPENPVCRIRSNSYNWIWNNRLVQNWKRHISRLYTAEYNMWKTRLDEAQAGIKIAGRNISNLRCHHTYGRKWRKTKKPLDESERGEWKSWLKIQHWEN